MALPKFDQTSGASLVSICVSRFLTSARPKSPTEVQSPRDPRRNVFAMLDDYKQNSSAHSFKPLGHKRLPGFGEVDLAKEKDPSAK